MISLSVDYGEFNTLASGSNSYCSMTFDEKECENNNLKKFDDDEINGISGAQKRLLPLN